MLNLSPYISTSAASDARWLALQDKSIFITGGSGLFGQWFLHALLDANQRLGTRIQATVLTRNPQSLEYLVNQSQQAITIWPGDIVDFTFPPSQFTHVLHMATTSAQETFAGKNGLAKFHMLVNGTERVLQFAAKCGAKKVTFTSSGVAYGAIVDGVQQVSEDYAAAPDPLNAETGLAQGKRAAEYLCSAYANQYAFDVTIARCFSFAGPGLPLNLHYAIGNFIHDTLHAESLTVKGDGTPMRSYLYLGDLTHWLLALLVDGQSNTIYNVGSDQAISIAELAYLVRDLLAPNKKVQILGDIHHNIGNFSRNWYVPDIQLAKTALNLDTWTTLEQAIINTAKSINSCT